MIAQAVVGDSRNAELVRRLRIALAGATNDAGYRRLARKAGARTAAAGHINQKLLLPERRIAEASRPIGVGKAAIYRIAIDEFAGTAIVPGDFRNVGKRRCLGRGIVRGAPVIADGDAVDVRVVLRHEIGTPHVDCIGGGGIVSAVDAQDRVICRLHRSALIRAVVPLRDEECRAFRRSQLRLAVLESDLGGAGDGFAQAVAVRDDVRWTEVDKTQNRQIQPGGRRRVRAGREFDIGIGRGGARPFDIERGLGLIAVLAGIGAAGINLPHVAGLELVETEGLAELRPVAGTQQIAVFDGGNGHTLARKALLPQRQKVVDGGEVVWGERVVDSPIKFYVEVRFPGVAGAIKTHRPESNGMRSRKEVMQRRDTLNRGRERGRNLRVADIRDVAFAIGQHQVVNFRMKCFADLGSGAGEVDHESVCV